MKGIRVWAFVFVGASALAGAAVFGQQPAGGGGFAGWATSSDDVAELAGHLGWHGSKAAELHSQSVKLAKQYAKAEKEDEKKDIRKKLTDVLSEQFDLQMKQQQKELEDLEKQVANLKTMLKKRVDAKSAIVDRRIDQLAQEADGMGWGGPNGVHSFFTPGGAGFGFGHGFSGTPAPVAAPVTPKKSK
jgi:polyhydroxyalkanoate synthesis regulator phasin